MATKLSNEIKKQVEQYQKAAKVSEAVQRMRETNTLVSRLASAGREIKNQGQSKQ